MRAQRGRALAAALLALAALSACGTTVGYNAQQAAGSDLNGGLGGDPLALPTDTGLPLPGSTSPTALGGGTAASPTAPGTGASGPSSLQTNTATVLNKPVEVGFAYSANAEAFLKALGINATSIDGRIYVGALLKYLNARGGFNGHKVNPVYYNVDLTRTDPYSVWMQEMCAMWTEDHKVIGAVVPANSDFSPVAQCLSKTGAIFGNTSAWVRSAKDYRTFPNWFEAPMIAGERLANAYIDVPEQLGYFGKKPKIGLLVYDYTQSRVMAASLLAQFKARGYPTPVVQVIHMGQSTAELSGTIASAQGATLQFRANGVTHVMSTAYPGAVAFFMIYADSQGYYPRYALTSSEGLIAVQATAPAASLKNAVAVGWLPNADVDASHQPTPNATTKLCYKIFTAAGIKGTDQPGGLAYCDFVLMLQHGAAALNPGSVSGRALRPALEGLGTSYLAPSGYGTLFGPRNHDGVQKVRPLRFDSGCSCFTYVGPPTAVRR